MRELRKETETDFICPVMDNYKRKIRNERTPKGDGNRCNEEI